MLKMGQNAWRWKLKKKQFEEENKKHGFEKKKIIIILIANFGYKKGSSPSA